MPVFFKELRAPLTERLSRKGGHLGWVLREDASSAHRRECYLAALLLPERQDTLHIMRYLPYEPSTPW